MNKTLTATSIFVALFAATAVLSGCTQAAAANQENSASVSLQEGVVSRQSFADSIINAASFPEQYSIRYEVTRASGIVETVAMAKDAAGNLYYQSGDQEMLFIREEDDRYICNGTTYTTQFVSEYTEAFTALAETSRQKNLPGIKAGEDTEVVGRACESYEIQAGFANFQKNYLLQVDKETGICMGWSESTSIGDYSASADGDVFICTEFRTNGIDLLTE